MMKYSISLSLQLLAVVIWMVAAPNTAVSAFSFVSTTHGSHFTSRTSIKAGGDQDEPDIVAKRIIVSGDVQGGYYRSCVLNEAGRFRSLVGTMSPPDDTDTAEIYIEGKRKMVEGFIRWCERGNVGLSQKATVVKVEEEEPTGLYDGFYVKTKA